MSSYRFLVEKLATVSRYVSCFLIYAVVFLVATEGLSRAIFNVSLPVNWEYASYSNGLLIFLAAADTYLANGHIRVSLLEERLGRRARTILLYLQRALEIALVGTLTYSFAQFTCTAFLRGEKAASASEIPLFYLEGAMTIGVILLLFAILSRAIRARD